MRAISLKSLILIFKGSNISEDRFYLKVTKNAYTKQKKTQTGLIIKTDELIGL